MTIAQHDPAPMRQQRWVELRNAGSVTIPAYGVCEIVGSVRPESGGPYTPGGGRTVMLVRRPEQDDPCAIIVNGPCEIPAGEEGRVGTKDDPLLALVDSDYPAGTGLGVVKDSFVLTERGCIRFVADGDYDSESGTMRVDRHDHCPNELIVRQLYECAKPGDEGTAQPQKWDEEAGDYVDDETMSPVTVKDPMCWRLALKDEKYKVERSNCSEESYRPSFPFGLTRRVKVTEDTDCNTASLVTIMFKTPSEEVSCTWSDGGLEPCKMYACNTSNRRLACDAEYEYATMHIMPGECIGWLVPDARPLFATATLTADLCGEAAGISGAAAIDVCDWQWRTPPSSAENPLGLYACLGNTVLLSWKSEDCKWYVTQVQPTVLESDQLPMVDVRCKESSCTVEKEVWKGIVAVQWCQSCGETEWKDSSMTGTEVDLYTSALDCENCQLTVTKHTLCIFCGSESEAQTPIPLVTVDIPDSASVDQDGDGSPEDPYTCALTFTTKRVCVLGCDLATSGDPITLQLDRIDPLTAGALAFDTDPEVEDPTQLCFTPSTTGAFVLGCILSEEEGEPSCVTLEVCPPDSSGGS